MPSRPTLLAPLPLLAAACLSSTAAPPDASTDFVGAGPRVLFVGNSHTYVNDVPGLVQALADSGGVGAIAVATLAKPNYALIDHWLEPAARDVAARCDGVTHVVLQQGWTPAGVWRDTLVLAAQGFASAVSRCGSRVALYQIWPPTSRPTGWEPTIESYAAAARAVGGVLAPVAEAWQIAARRDPSIPLYSPDGLHASTAGSYLAAVVLYARLFDRSPVGLPAAVRTRGGATLRLPPAWARTLQESAREATSR